MRWLLIGMTIASLGAVYAVASPAPKAPDCTRVGTPQRDIMAGSPGRDVFCARAGGDYLSGGGRRDVLRGDGGEDTIVGGKGPDVLIGRGGNDRLFGIDGAAGDTLEGGAGNDVCFADPGDKVSGCQRTFRGPSLRLANALGSAFNGQGSLAEQLISPVPAPVVVTVTDTMTVPENCGGHPAPPPIC